ncbi:MAG: polysaccharide deacetylase family protein, partial [Desulfovibrio sp.]|nr:polysaccharide deacetylase family protein [Desulfovibrio sp.]
MKKLLLFLLCLWASQSMVQARVIGGYEMMDQEMEDNLCVLTFDDGPSIYTEHLLDMLKEYNVKATFFVLGKMANHYPHIVKRAAEEGHEIATHTFSHKNLKKLSFARQLEEIHLGYESLARLGLAPKYMRPPYGSFDERTRTIAEAYGMHVVLWS